MEPEIELHRITSKLSYHNVITFFRSVTTLSVHTEPGGFGGLLIMEYWTIQQAPPTRKVLLMQHLWSSLAY